MKPGQQSIGRERAIALAKTEWWKGRTPREIAKFQLFTVELSMPFDVFHEALEASLDRPVFPHELGVAWESIMQEFLGERDKPTMEEIMGLIPEEKRLAIFVQPV